MIYITDRTVESPSKYDAGSSNEKINAENEEEIIKPADKASVDKENGLYYFFRPTVLPTKPTVPHTCNFRDRNGSQKSVRE